MPRQAEIRKIERTDRAKKWGISMPQEGRRARRIWFETPRARDLQFNRLKRETQREGLQILSTSSADLQLLNDLREILPDDVDPREAARFYVEQRCPVSITLKDAIRAYFKMHQIAGTSTDHIRHLEVEFKRLTEFFPRNVNISEITKDHITDLLMKFDFKPATLANYQKDYKAFFNWCIRQKYCTISPMAGMKKIRIPESEPGFMPVEDAERFFKTALELYPKYTPVLALSFFAGMRSAAIPRLTRADLDFIHRGIRHQGATHKTRRRFFVQGFEENLWAWLEPWRSVQVLPGWISSHAIKMRRRIYEKAGVEFPHNAGRHSFCTYHVALHGNAERTATLLTHRGSVSTLYDHYRGNATQADARAYFSIMP